MTKFNFSPAQSKYVYINDKPIAFINVFVEDGNGCFTQTEALRFVKECNKDFDILNPCEFKYKSAVIPASKTGGLCIENPVKLINPTNEKEKNLVYRIVNYNEITQRVYITPINSDLLVPGQELVSISEVYNYKAIK